MDTLKTYLKQQENTYFTGFYDRVALANELINSFNAETDTRARSQIMPKFTPFLNPENIMLRPVRNDETGEIQYSVEFPHKEDIVGEEEKEYFNNIEFASADLHLDKIILVSKRSTNRDIYRRECKNEEAVAILSKILFFILFCRHPYKGRDYFRRINYTYEDEYEFFSRPLKFIFDIKANTNRFVNGYHEYARILWESLSEYQKHFFIDAFNGKFADFKSCFQAWTSSFFMMRKGEATSPCGEKFGAIIFNSDHIIICSENSAQAHEFYCKYGKAALHEKCETCSFQKYARVLTNKVWVLTVRQSDDADAKVMKTEELLLYNGKVIDGNDFEKDSTLTGSIFTVVTSKKSNLLGLKYTGNSKVMAVCGQAGRVYSNGDAVALLPGAVIMVSNKYWISVPANK